MNSKLALWLSIIVVFLLSGCEGIFTPDSSSVQVRYPYVLQSIVQANKPVEITFGKMQDAGAGLVAGGSFLEKSDTFAVVVNGDALHQIVSQSSQSLRIASVTPTTPGDRIHITVTYNNTQLNGQTEIPGTFRIQGLVDGNLHWTPSSRARAYLVHLSLNLKDSGAERKDMDKRMLFDTTYPLQHVVRNIKSYVAEQGNDTYQLDSVYVAVQAIDDNFYVGVLDAQATQVGVQNSYGIVASYVEKKTAFAIDDITG